MRYWTQPRVGLAQWYVSLAFYLSTMAVIFVLIPLLLSSGSEHLETEHPHAVRFITTIRSNASRATRKQRMRDCIEQRENSSSSPSSSSSDSSSSSSSSSETCTNTSTCEFLDFLEIAEISEDSLFISTRIEEVIESRPKLPALSGAVPPFSWRVDSELNDNHSAFMVAPEETLVRIEHRLKNDLLNSSRTQDVRGFLLTSEECDRVDNGQLQKVVERLPWSSSQFAEQDDGGAAAAEHDYFIEEADDDDDDDHEDDDDDDDDDDDNEKEIVREEGGGAENKKKFKKNTPPQKNSNINKKNRNKKKDNRKKNKVVKTKKSSTTGNGISNNNNKKKQAAATRRRMLVGGIDYFRVKDLLKAAGLTIEQIQHDGVQIDVTVIYSNLVGDVDSETKRKRSMFSELMTGLGIIPSSAIYLYCVESVPHHRDASPELPHKANFFYSRRIDKNPRTGKTGNEKFDSGQQKAEEVTENDNDEDDEHEERVLREKTRKELRAVRTHHGARIKFSTGGKLGKNSAAAFLRFLAGASALLAFPRALAEVLLTLTPICFKFFQWQVPAWWSEFVREF